MSRISRVFNRAHAIAIATLVSFLISSAAFASAALPNIKNFGRIDDSYYRGAQPEGHDYSDLASLGIRTVINLTSDDAEKNEKSMVEAAGMKYVQIPMTTHVPPTPAQIAEFLQIVNDSASGPVYVHCVGGRHRTGVMTAIYRMAHGWNADQSFQEMKQFKFGADFLHSEFKKFVFDFYSKLPRPVAPVATASVQ